jgi:hypothetical protein
MKKYTAWVIATFALVLFSCRDESEENIPTKPAIIDTVPKIDTNKVVVDKAVEHANPYKIYEDKIFEQPIIKTMNKDLAKLGKAKLFSKINDSPKDSVFSIKLGTKIDTSFVQKYEFFIHKKSKVISVYDVGEDRLIPLSEWSAEEQE